MLLVQGPDTGGHGFVRTWPGCDNVEVWLRWVAMGADAEALVYARVPERMEMWASHPLKGAGACPAASNRLLQTPQTTTEAANAGHTVEGKHIKAQ